MVISPNDFSLWARLTGNKYPSTPKERAQKGPEVQNFIQNLGKEGMLGGKEAEEPKKENNLGKNIAKGALIAGGIAALGAASRDKRVQDIAQRAASTTKTKIDDFLSNLGGPRVIDRDVVDASYDVTPDPVQQQSNIGSQVNKFLSEGSYKRDYKPNVNVDVEIGPDPYTPPVSQRKELVAVDNYTPVVEGKTFGTSGAISKLEDIGDAKLRARRTYGPMIDAVQQKNPGINVGSMGRSMLAKAEQDRDYDIAYMVAKGQGKDDVSATQIARQTAGFPTNSPVGKPTPYREFLGEQRTGSIRPESIDNLLNLVKTGPQINLPESVQEPGALVQLAAGSTPSNKVPTMGPTIGGSSLTDQHATEMAVDNALDNARANYDKQISTIVEAGQTKGGSISNVARAEKFLQKMRPTVVKELDKAIQEDLTKTTGLNPEDASNIAQSVIDPITGQRQFNTDQFGSTGAVKRDLKDLRSVPNIDPKTRQGKIKTAVGTAIRGRAPIYNEPGFVTKQRQNPLGKEGEMISDRPSKERAEFTPTPFDEDQQTRIMDDITRIVGPKEGGSAGIGIYGEETGYVPGPFSSTARTKPTDAPGTTSKFKGISDSTLTKLKSDMKPGTKSFESVDKEQKGRASIDAARELRKVQTSGDPSTATERVAKFLDNLKKQQGG